MAERKIAIIGTVGVPGNYGGFETLAENLVNHHGQNHAQSALTVYCSARTYPNRSPTYGSAKLRYIPLDANGVQSIPYDALSLFDAALRGHDRLLLLGVSGAAALPILRLFSRVRIVTNIDGIEWKREKWQGLARLVLRASEWLAVRFSHRVIADNQAIADYITERYNIRCDTIPYGGDHSLAAEADPAAVADLPGSYALALCRIEPENNVAMILEAWASLDRPLVFVGNWTKSEYGRELRARYDNAPYLHLLDPVYEPRTLRAIRGQASVYVHGHSAGGTNPSLVEMMHFGIPVLAHGCSFNRHTTENRARYFESSAELVEAVSELTADAATEIGAAMSKVAQRRYTWDQIGKAYFELLEE
jgi:glycosyltransferase involved in cell wall biosynthesis